MKIKSLTFDFHGKIYLFILFHLNLLPLQPEK